VTGEFRQYLYPPGHPRIADVEGLDAYAYREAARHDDFTGGLIKGWTPLYLNEFVGITEDGQLREDAHAFAPALPGEEAPMAAMVAAAARLLDLLDEEGRSKIAHDVDAPQWQTWANPEFMQFDTGIRLEFQDPEVREAALALVQASLSPEGYALAHEMMLINDFLGQVVGLESILNEFSYNIALYGTPSTTAPWGWQLFGHHLALNCLVVEGRMSLSPVFLGAEPNEIDEGPHAGGESFTTRIELALELMAALSHDQRTKATTYAEMVDPAMPADRVHPGDERHLAGAFQDNRVIPLEGICASELSAGARRLVLEVVEQFVALLPDGPRAARMREVEAHLDETWFSWIGGHQQGDVFYFRIQSPVIIVELDHHTGVFLDYDTPKPFHIHTVMRTPHGNDYGRAWVRQWQEANQ
jgi:hypothetical protein